MFQYGSYEESQEQSLKSSAIYVQPKINKDKHLMNQETSNFQYSQNQDTNNHSQKKEKINQNKNQTYAQQNEEYLTENFQEDSSLPLCMQHQYSLEKVDGETLSKKQKTISQEISQISQYRFNKNQQTQDSGSRTNNNNIKQSKNDRKLMNSSDLPLQLYRQRNNLLSLQLQQQKLKNLHLERIIEILQQQSEVSRNKFRGISEEYWNRISNYNELQVQKDQLKNHNEQLLIQNQHFKDLIYLANKNYEQIQKKYQENRQKLLIFEKQKEQRQKQYNLKMDELKKAIKEMIKNFKSQQVIYQSSGHQQNEKNNIHPTARESQKQKNLNKNNIDSSNSFNMYINNNINDKQNCFSFGENQRRQVLLIESKNKKVLPNILNGVNFNSKAQLNRMGLKQLNLNECCYNSQMQLPPSTIRQDKQFASMKFTNRSNNGKDFLLNSTLNNQNKLANTIQSGMKSPKNNIQENYRKIFMKTLMLGKGTNTNTQNL